MHCVFIGCLRFKSADDTANQLRAGNFTVIDATVEHGGIACYTYLNKAEYAADTCAATDNVCFIYTSDHIYTSARIVRSVSYKSTNVVGTAYRNLVNAIFNNSITYKLSDKTACVVCCRYNSSLKCEVLDSATACHTKEADIACTGKADALDSFAVTVENTGKRSCLITDRSLGESCEIDIRCELILFTPCIRVVHKCNELFGSIYLNCRSFITLCSRGFSLQQCL